MNNLISIITPNYNSEEFISETIISVINQTFKNWEMIIVDDVSTDNSLSIITSFCKQDSRIKLHKLSENSGAAIARNKAISFLFLNCTLVKVLKFGRNKTSHFLRKRNHSLTNTS